MCPILQGKMGRGSWKEEDIHWLAVIYQIHCWYYCTWFSKSCYTTVILSPIFKVIKLRVRCSIGNLAATARRWKDRNKIVFSWPKLMMLFPHLTSSSKLGMSFLCVHGKQCSGDKTGNAASIAHFLLRVLFCSGSQVYLFCWVVTPNPASESGF